MKTRVSEYRVASKILPSCVKAYTKKKTALIRVLAPGESVSLDGNYWSGGSIEHYTLIDMANNHSTHPLRGPQPFGSGPFNTEVTPARRQLVVNYGQFCGKPSTLTVYVRADDRLEFALGNDKTAAELIGLEGARAQADLPVWIVRDMLIDCGYPVCADRFCALFGELLND